MVVLALQVLVVMAVVEQVLSQQMLLMELQTPAVAEEELQALHQITAAQVVQELLS